MEAAKESGNQTVVQRPMKPSNRPSSVYGKAQIMVMRRSDRLIRFGMIRSFFKNTTDFPHTPPAQSPSIA